MRLNLNKEIQQRNCIFCKKEASLSDEHLFSEWMHGLFDKSIQGRSQIRVQVALEREATLISPDLNMGQGKLLNKKIKGPCHPCNNEWMSKSETKVAPILSSLIKGNRTTLDTAKQNDIALWSAIKTVIGEYTDLPTQGISQYERSYIYEKKEPPPHWQIYIGQFFGKQDMPAYKHIGSRATYDTQPRIPKFLALELPCNTQMTTLMLGHICIHIRSTTDKYINLPQISPVKDLALLWPNQDVEISFPRKNGWTERDANNCHLNLHDKNRYKIN
jgi:hypothetical protein